MRWTTLMMVALATVVSIMWGARQLEKQIQPPLAFEVPGYACVDGDRVFVPGRRVGSEYWVIVEGDEPRPERRYINARSLAPCEAEPQPR